MFIINLIFYWFIKVIAKKVEVCRSRESQVSDPDFIHPFKKMTRTHTHIYYAYTSLYLKQLQVE